MVSARFRRWQTPPLKTWLKRRAHSVSIEHVALDDPNAVGATTLNGINDKGDIVGFYTDAAGNTDGLLAVPDNDKSVDDMHHHATQFSGWALDV